MQIMAMSIELLIARANDLATRIDAAETRPTKWLAEFDRIAKRLKALNVDLATAVKSPENW